ncbi:MAG: DUF1648 domain-containing protein [Armatimonadetes bacterium]|nr:DUF1648 domain-containing protein [Armatimonadota bacterium]
MNTRMAALIGSGLTLALLGYTLILYPSLPDRIPTHWNVHGQVDGYGSKIGVAFFGPALAALFTVLMLLLPWLSPMNFKVDSFRETFNYLFLIVTGRFSAMHLLMLQAALHPGLDVGRAILSSVFLFLALMGNVLGKVRRNFWVGVRTPWTLASERVWESTHRLAAKLLALAGLFGAVGVWSGLPVWLCLAALTGALFAPVFYSLYLYKQGEQEEPGS